MDIHVYHYRRKTPYAPTPMYIAFPDEDAHRAKLLDLLRRSPELTDGERYEKVATVECTDAPRNVAQYPNLRDGWLERAFELTNHIDRAWTDNAGVTVANDKPQRSTSVGDVIVLGESAYVVAGVGFEAL